MKYIFVLVLILVFVSACSPTLELPNDFELKYSKNSCGEKIDGLDFSINSKAMGTIKIVEGDFEKQEKYELSEEDVLKIYSEILKNDFFEMNETYEGNYSEEAICQEIQVNADGNIHKVLIKNSNIKEFNEIVKEIADVMISEDIIWDKINKGELCTTARNFCEIQLNYKGKTCEEWEEMC